MKDALISWKNKIENPKMVTIKMMILRDKLKANVYTLEMPKSYGVVYKNTLLWMIILLFLMDFKTKKHMKYLIISQ